jgi:dienelactone hydrolase
MHLAGCLHYNGIVNTCTEKEFTTMQHRFRSLCSITFLLIAAVSAQAGIQTKTVAYHHGDTRLEGFLAWDDRFKEKRPGVLVVHEWWGMNDYARQRARQLAESGYVAFALDMYGAGKVTSHPDQASTWMKQIKENSAQWVARANAGLEILKAQNGVDKDNIAAIGYCFGGATVIEMAYAGLDIRLAGSFHGSLPLAGELQPGSVETRIFAAHGSADPFIKPDQPAAFRAGLDAIAADWTMMEFGGVKHSFTNPNAGSYGIDALAYDENADRQSWHMLLWLLEDSFR